VAAAVLLLHGGRETGLRPPPPGLLNLPALRMRPFARAVIRATRDEPVEVVAAGPGLGTASHGADHSPYALIDALNRDGGGVQPVGPAGA
jgi:hypothetical protein